MAEKITRAKAIRLKCLDCCGGIAAEVRKCSMVRCPLHPYRMGKTVAMTNLAEVKHAKSIVG